MSNRTEENTGATCAQNTAEKTITNQQTCAEVCDAYTLEQLAKAADLIRIDGCAVIHSEYYGRVSDRRCFCRHIITLNHWRRMTRNNERRWWKARAKYGCYRWGYLAKRWCRRYLLDNTKVIDTWQPIERLPGDDFHAIYRDINDVIKEVR